MRTDVDSLKFAADQAVAANKVQDLASDAKVKRQLVNGAITEFPLLIKPRAHQVQTLEEIVKLAHRFTAGPSEDGMSEAPGPKKLFTGRGAPDASCVAWFNETGVTLVFDDADRRENTATLPLAYSDVFASVLKLRSQKPWFTQAEFIMLLRIELAGTLDPSVLLDKVRRIDMEKKQSAEIKRGQESMGASITAVAHKDAIPPEEVTLALPVFKTPGERAIWTVECSVDFEVSRGSPFRLLPCPDEVERVIAVHMATIADRLQAALPPTVPFHFGSP